MNDLQLVLNQVGAAAKQCVAAGLDIDVVCAELKKLRDLYLEALQPQGEEKDHKG